jgi:hypothetical protein
MIALRIDVHLHNIFVYDRLDKSGTMLMCVHQPSIEQVCPEELCDQ